MKTKKSQMMLTKPEVKVISLHIKGGNELKIPLSYLIKAELEEGKKIFTGWSYDIYAG